MLGIMDNNSYATISALTHNCDAFTLPGKWKSFFFEYKYKRFIQTNQCKVHRSIEFLLFTCFVFVWFECSGLDCRRQLYTLNVKA